LVVAVTKVSSLSLSPQSRSRFLSSSAAAFFTSGAVLASDPEACSAMQQNNNNPRYIDQDLEMKYGEDKQGNPRTRGMLVRRFTGDSTPYQFPVSPVRLVKEWPEEPPFEAQDFFRADEIDDGSFYAVPRLVYHIDEPAVAALTQYYRKNIPAGSTVLDICSSWVSHYPLEFPETMKRISATGMNPLELKFNDQLTDFEAKNLNVDPKLPYADNTFNVVTCVVSIDYLIHPIEVLKEVQYSVYDICLNGVSCRDTHHACRDTHHASASSRARSFTIASGESSTETRRKGHYFTVESMFSIQSHCHVA
jgi:hypothetical protein